MKRLLYIAIILLGAGILPALAGDPDVHGAVWGTWSAGSTVVISGPVNVPEDKRLTIEPGVWLRFKTSEPLIVSGTLSASGTPDNPILISAPEGWGGFKFESNSPEWNTLYWVVVDAQGGTPEIAVSATNAHLRIGDCRLRGLRGCLEIDGGWLLADSNTFLSTRQFSRAVTIHDLRNADARHCDDANANHFKDNMISVDVLASGQPSDQATVGLWVEGSTSTCLSRNVITVRTPGMAVGAYFTEPGDGGSPMWALDLGVITVRSTDRQPNGVLAAHNGILSLNFCTIDIASDNLNSNYYPRGVLASDQASVDVKNSLVQLDHGDRFFRGLSGGSLTISFTRTWTVTGSIQAPMLKVDPMISPLRDDPGNVIIGQNVSFADPLIRRSGVWGAWSDIYQVYDYYGLTANSPCIDAGDTTGYGLDPNNTLPDIGRFYYGEFGDIDEAVGHNPGAVPTDMALLAAYPNPFNATTVIPYVIAKSGVVRITVFDVTGREVAVLASGPQSAGSHEVQFGANSLSSGLYFVTMEMNGERLSSRPVVLLK